MKNTLFQWKPEDLSTCMTLGKMWLIFKVDQRVHCYRVRKKASKTGDTSLYIRKDEKKVFKSIPDVAVGNLLYVISDGNMQQLFPDGEFAEQVRVALEKI